MHFPAADSWAFQKYPKSFILSKDKLHELLCSFIWCEVGCFAYRSANWNSWESQPISPPADDSAAVPLASAGRPRQQDAVLAARSHPGLAGAEVRGEGGSTALLPQGRGCRVRKGCSHPSEPTCMQTVSKAPTKHRASTSPGVSEIFPVSAVFLSLSLITAGIIKHSNFRIWKDRAKSKFSYMSSSLFTPLFCIRWVRLNSSYQFTIS